MKVTNFGPDGLPIALAGWSTGVVSLNSNVEIVGGGPQALNFVQRITANTSNTLQNPIVNFASGSGISLAAASNTITISSSGGGGTISAGSNSTAVQEISTAGASTTLWSPYDHAHAGIATITASSSNTLQRGTFNLRAGSGIAIALTDTDGDGEFDTATLVNTASASSIGAAGAAQYPPLKPATPTDDFNTSTLNGAWTAHSNTGSFTTSHVMTQGEAWAGSAVELQFSAQSGTIYRTHADTDLDFQVGGLRANIFQIGGSGVVPIAMGIAALTTAGNGMCVMVFNDNSVYFAPVVTYSQSGAVEAWGSFGTTVGPTYGDWWLRLKRVSGTWTAYASVSGRTWDKTFTTDSTSYTIAQLHFGTFRSNAMSGRIMADYFHVDV